MDDEDGEEFELISDECREELDSGHTCDTQAAVEQERLSRFEGLDPVEFWRERGEDAWGPVLTLRELVKPRG